VTTEKAVESRTEAVFCSTEMSNCLASTKALAAVGSAAGQNHYHYGYNRYGYSHGNNGALVGALAGAVLGGVVGSTTC